MLLEGSEQSEYSRHLEFLLSSIFNIRETAF